LQILEHLSRRGFHVAQFVGDEMVLVGVHRLDCRSGFRDSIQERYQRHAHALSGTPFRRLVPLPCPFWRVAVIQHVFFVATVLVEVVAVVLGDAAGLRRLLFFLLLGALLIGCLDVGDIVDATVCSHSLLRLDCGIFRTQFPSPVSNSTFINA